MRPSASRPGVTAILVLLSGAAIAAAAESEVAPERRPGWERERRRAQSVAELLVRQESTRRDGTSGGTRPTGGAAASRTAPSIPSRGPDAGLDELFLEDESSPSDTVESAPLLPVSVPEPAPPRTPAPVVPPPVPAAVDPSPEAPLLAPPTPAAPAGVELFHLGYSHFSQGDWEGAREAFAAFAAAHPAHDLTDNAAYWMAECAAQEGRFEVALDEFQEVARRYPGSDKAPDIQIRIAVLRGETGRPDEGRRLLQQVVRDWPGTAAARKAAELLASDPPATR